MLKTWTNRLKIKINDRLLSNTRGITLLHSIFDVLTINGNLYWKRGRIELKSKILLRESGVGSRWNIFNKNWWNFYKEYKVMSVYLRKKDRIYSQKSARDIISMYFLIKINNNKYLFIIFFNDLIGFWARVYTKFDSTYTQVLTQ